MTKVRFYTDVTAPTTLVTALCQQALQRQRKITVYLTDRKQALEWDAALWQTAPTDFLPHVLADAYNAPITPIVLAWQPDQIQQDDVLLNCQPVQPLFFGRFRHLFEVVGTGEEEKAAARLRWAFYRDRGYDIQHQPQLQS